MSTFPLNMKPANLSRHRQIGPVLALLFSIALNNLSHGHTTGPDHHTHAATTPYASLSKGGCQEPTLKCARSATPLVTQDGTLWLVWSAGGAVSVARSSNFGQSFEPRIEVARHDAFLDTGPDARPQLVADTDGNLIVAYAFFRDKNWNAQVNISTSHDSGKNFSRPVPLSKDPSSQRFASLSVDPQGYIFATWIDKRIAAAASAKGGKHPGGSIAYSWSMDGGRSFATEHIAQPDSCECCRVAVTMSPSGLPVIVYRAIFAGHVRDHASQLFVERDQPGPARRISDDNWETDSCPHHGPSVAVSPSNTLHTAWFTQGSKRSGTFYARSTDAGVHYSQPRAVGNPDAQPGRPYLLASGHRLWLVWKEFDGKRAAIYMQQSSDDGLTWSLTREIATSVGYSDHPLLVARANETYLSWLTAAEGYRLIELGTEQ